jgi:hypothetical protein
MCDPMTRACGDLDACNDTTVAQSSTDLHTSDWRALSFASFVNFVSFVNSARGE